jgi:hypothetical protein
MSATALVWAMKKLIVVASVLLAILQAPAGNAADACGVLHDPVSDVYPVWGISLGIGPRADAIDLTGVQMQAAGDSLAVVVGVRDLASTLGPGVEGATFVVDWKTNEQRRVYARAIRTGDIWTYEWSDSDQQLGEATGSISGNTITINVPLQVATAGSTGTLDELTATSYSEATDGRSGWMVRAPAATDYAPNFTGGPRRFQLGSGCAAAVMATGSSCTVLSADPATPAQPQGSIDLRSVSFALAGESMVAEFHVADLSAPASGSAERWEVSWFNPRFYDNGSMQSAFADRVGDRVEFGYVRAYSTATTTGSLDRSTDTVRVNVPRDWLDLADGTRIKQVRARASVTSGSISTGTVLPDTGDGGSWVISTSCSASAVQMCPIVVDRKGDARYAEATDEVPENYAGLDLRALGAIPAGDQVKLTARVENLRAPDPPGADVVGWTISWLDGEHRIYAQAERYPEGLVFRYGAIKSSNERPTGPVFAGTATTGSLDITNNIVEIAVPRALMPGDGTDLEGMGATAWGLAGRNSAAVYLVWDETLSRSYIAGAVCSV